MKEKKERKAEGTDETPLYVFQEGMFYNALKSLPKLLNLKPDNVLKTIYHFSMTLKFQK